MASTVLEALAARQLYVALQPVVNLRKREVFGYEALVRSSSPLFRNPGEILKKAIEEGCLGELGRGLRAMAVSACPRTNLFLNLHPNEFDEGWLVRPDDPIFVHDRHIYLEITESVPLSHFRLCHSVLKEVRSKGIYLAVDDLGAGYSNLKYIADLAPEIVKLDRMLVANLVEDSRLFRLVRSVVKLCVELDARVVAEGIETAQELQAVNAAGVHFGQGFFIAYPANPPPKPNGEMREVLEFLRLG